MKEKPNKSATSKKMHGMNFLGWKKWNDIIIDFKIGGQLVMKNK